MSKIKDGGPAFPTTNYYDEKPIGMNYGMFLRDYFAAKAMQALIDLTFDLYNVDNDSIMTRRAYEIADAMLRARER